MYVYGLVLWRFVGLEVRNFGGVGGLGRCRCGGLELSVRVCDSVVRVLEAWRFGGGLHVYGFVCMRVYVHVKVNIPV